MREKRNNPIKCKMDSNTYRFSKILKISNLFLYVFSKERMNICVKSFHNFKLFLNADISYKNPLKIVTFGLPYNLISKGNK